MSFGKLITQPLFLLTVTSMLLLILAARRTEDRVVRRMLFATWTALAALLVLSVPLTGSMLQRLIQVEPEAIQPPDLIVVAGGGYGRVSGMGQPISADSVHRVLRAVEWWKSNPDAVIVMAGEQGDPDPGTIPMAVQMKRLAETSGVPPSQIRIEPVSRNTREHPVALMQFVGIPPDTRIGVVTSPWHVRRTAREFRRYYGQVVLPPVHDTAPRIGSLGSWIPQADGLNHSTAVIHEVIGLVWSEMLFRLFGPPELRIAERSRYDSGATTRLLRGGTTG